MAEQPATLTAIAGRLRRGEVTAVRVTRDCLDRIEAAQPCLNAFLHLDAEGALAAAAAADRALQAGVAPGPLHGVPLAHKDMFDRAGRAPSCGTRVPADRIPAQDAECLRRLSAAGALWLGGLNMSEFACNGWGYNIAGGTARNPHAPDHVAGGSSSGSAAAVAAGLVYGALGSDTGGSVRLPAAWCGCVGLLPTRGLVPMTGAMKLSPSLDAIGPIARNVADCARLLGAVADCDDDPEAALALPMAGCRIGIPEVEGLDPVVARPLEDAAHLCRELGIACRPQPPLQTERITAAANIVLLSELCALHLEPLRRHGSLYSPWVRERLLTGIGIAATDYIAALSQRGAALEAFCTGAMAEVDALLLPVVPHPAPRLDQVLATVERGAPPPPDVGPFTRWTNYLGLPALTLPCGATREGLPLAVQLLGRPFGEGLLLRLGHHLEAAIAGRAGAAYHG